MLRKDVPITTIQETMGHSSIETTMVYAKISQKKALQDMKKAFLTPKKTRISDRSK